MSLFAMKIELFLKNNTVFDRVKRKMKGKMREMEQGEERKAVSRKAREKLSWDHAMPSTSF